MKREWMHKAKWGRGPGLEYQGEKFTKKKPIWRETFGRWLSSIWMQPNFGLDWDGKRFG